MTQKLRHRNSIEVSLHRNTREGEYIGCRTRRHIRAVNHSNSIDTGNRLPPTEILLAEYSAALDRGAGTTYVFPTCPE